MTGGTLASKVFDTLHEATRFAVYKVVTGNVFSIDKID
jgi:hypothetical protein